MYAAGTDVCCCEQKPILVAQLNCSEFRVQLPGMLFCFGLRADHMRARDKEGHGHERGNDSDADIRQIVEQVI